MTYTNNIDTTNNEVLDSEVIPGYRAIYGEPPATMSTTEKGGSYYIEDVYVDDYIWHRGCYRRVTANNGRTIRMGRYALKPRRPVELLEWWKPMR